MKLSFEWLQQYVEVRESVADVAHRLTMIGLETTRIDEIGVGWEHIVAGSVVALRDHRPALALDCGWSTGEAALEPRGDDWVERAGRDVDGRRRLT